jgi:hypothetical protein
LERVSAYIYHEVVLNFGLALLACGIATRRGGVTRK